MVACLDAALIERAVPIHFATEIIADAGRCVAVDHTDRGP
jgi:hypothetical protein